MMSLGRPSTIITITIDGMLHCSAAQLFFFFFFKFLIIIIIFYYYFKFGQLNRAILDELLNGRFTPRKTNSDCEYKKTDRIDDSVGFWLIDFGFSSSNVLRILESALKTLVIKRMLKFFTPAREISIFNFEGEINTNFSIYISFVRLSCHVYF